MNQRASTASDKPNPRQVHVEQLANAEDAAAQDHGLGLFQALRLYPKGVLWSVIMSTALVMEGYDTKLISSLFAQPAFREHYGRLQEDGSYQIPAPWQAGLTNGSEVGQLCGLLIAGSLSERLGFRRTMILGLVTIMGLVFIQFFASSLIMLEIGQILLGIPLGLLQTIPVVYAIEISPTSLRAHLTTYINVCWIFGQVAAVGVLRGVLDMDNRWAFRIPFAIQWFWPLVLIPGIYFAPESPWWLVRQGRLDEARDVIMRLTSPDNVSFDVDKNVTLMVVTTEHEREMNAGTSYRACFVGANLRRTIIVIGAFCSQYLSGNSLRGYSTYFFQQAGLPTDQAFNMSIVGFAVGIVGMMVAWFALPHIGRRTIYLIGLGGIFTILIAIGSLGVPQASSPSSGLAWGIGALLVASAFVYNCTIGPVAYSLISEIPSALLRSKSVVLARWASAIIGIISNVVTPYQLNPSAWDWGARTAFFWAGTTFLAILFTYFYIPEPKGRATAELDILFENGTSARQFSRTPVYLSEIMSKPGIEKV